MLYECLVLLWRCSTGIRTGTARILIYVENPRIKTRGLTLARGVTPAAGTTQPSQRAEVRRINSGPLCARGRRCDCPRTAISQSLDRAYEAHPCSLHVASIQILRAIPFAHTAIQYENRGLDSPVQQ